MGRGRSVPPPLVGLVGVVGEDGNVPTGSVGRAKARGPFTGRLRILRRFAATYAKASVAKLALLAGLTLLSVSHRFNRAGFDLFWSVGL